MKVFISYTRGKDEFNSVSELRKHFTNELLLLVPGSTVFQDTDQIRAGDHFPEKLTSELNTSSVLMILISPAWLSSSWCRREFEIFVARERERNRSPRLLPVLWVQTDELQQPSSDPVIQELSQIQFADWTTLRHEDWKIANVRKEIAELARRAKTLGLSTAEEEVPRAHLRQTIVEAQEAKSIPELFNKVLGDWGIWQKSGDRNLFVTAGENYVAKMNELYDTVRILGMNAPVRLRNIYVRVNILEKITARHDASVKELEQFFQRDRRGFGRTERTITGVEVVNTLRKFIVLGKPGAGKTTFLKRIALIALDSLLSTMRVPIFVSLKEWSESGSTLLQFMASQFDACGFPDAVPYVRRLLNNGKCLLLLDGFDEVTGDVGKAVSEIKDFSNRYFQNQIILSCRIAAYDYVFEQFTEVEMADFEDAQICEFIDNWFGQGSPKATSCWSQLRIDSAIRELASVPLLLTMLCLAFDEQMTFPTNRSELYREAVNALLKKWDTSRNIIRQDVYKQLTLRRKENLLGHLAFRMFQEERYFFERRLLESYVSDYIQHLPGADEQNLELDSEAIVKSIEAHHGLLVERARGIYSFSHLTVQEYFTACHIVDHWGEVAVQAVLLPHLLEHDWREVILLAAGMLTPADKLLRAIRGKVTLSANRDVLSLLKAAGDCVMDPQPSLHLSVAWAIVFIVDRIRAVKIAGELRPNSSSAFEYSREASVFDVQQAKLAGDSSYYLDRILDRATYVVRVMDPEFNPRTDFGKRADVRRSFGFSRALDYVRAHDHLRRDYHDLFESFNTYLYGTELLYQCLNGECYISKPVRTELVAGLFVEER